MSHGQCRSALMHERIGGGHGQTPQIQSIRPSSQGLPAWWVWPDAQQGRKLRRIDKPCAVICPQGVSCSVKAQCAALEAAKARLTKSLAEEEAARRAAEAAADIAQDEVAARLHAAEQAEKARLMLRH